MAENQISHSEKLITFYSKWNKNRNVMWFKYNEAKPNERTKENKPSTTPSYIFRMNFGFLTASKLQNELEIYNPNKQYQAKLCFTMFPFWYHISRVSCSKVYKTLVVFMFVVSLSEITKSKKARTNFIKSVVIYLASLEMAIDFD